MGGGSEVMTGKQVPTLWSVVLGFEEPQILLPVCQCCFKSLLLKALD